MTPEEIQAYADNLITERRRLKKEHNNRVYRGWYLRHRKSVISRTNDYASAHPEEIRVWKKQWAEANQTRIRSYQHVYNADPNNKKRKKLATKKCHLKKNYNITPEEKAAMFIAQGSVCKLCSSPDKGGKCDWAVEHDHNRKKIRGVTCCHCNRMVGGARDQIMNLARGVTYLADASGEDISEVISYLQRYECARS